ncbi:exodeoxyribonuclease VII small subunit [Deinococcus sonorensis]|uniref:Exodeoxyribonuclease VII small subunit n=2 Tax=Deinococcus sonorensis TaxID=309891 RepID=A0AAU7UC24_9DEIO
MPRKPAAPTTYQEAYRVLSRIALELDGGEADLDRVLPLIEEAQVAYQVCRSRIEALRSALDELAGGLPDPLDDPGDDEDDDSDE